VTDGVSAWKRRQYEKKAVDWRVGEKGAFQGRRKEESEEGAEEGGETRNLRAVLVITKVKREEEKRWDGPLNKGTAAVGMPFWEHLWWKGEE